MAKLLELDEDYFLDRLNEAPAFARFNYYPPCPRPDLVFGIRPHSDGTLLTILLVDKDVSGLQVQRDGKWSNVEATPHTLLINLGDTMEVIALLASNIQNTYSLNLQTSSTSSVSYYKTF